MMGTTTFVFKAKFPSITFKKKKTHTFFSIQKNKIKATAIIQQHVLTIFLVDEEKMVLNKMNENEMNDCHFISH